MFNFSYLVVLFLIIHVTAIAQVKQVLFVCEHGSAKSVVAAAHFKALAEKENLELTIISRGINPDETVPQKINDFLKTDGLPQHTGTPQKVSSNDIASSNYIIAFNPIPGNLTRGKHIINWTVPAISDGYTASRDSIIVNLKDLILKIKSDNKK